MIVPGRVNIGVQQIDAPNAHPAIVPMGTNGDMKILIVGGMSREEMHAGNILAANPCFGVASAFKLAREIVAEAEGKPSAACEPEIQTR